jgi:flagellar hook protein FlgE
MNYNIIVRKTLLAAAISMLLSGDGICANPNLIHMLKNENISKNSCIFAPVQPTTMIKINVNLNASDRIPIVAFDPNNYQSFNFVTNAVLYDSLGVLHTVSIMFLKKSTNEWISYVMVDFNLIGSGDLIFDTSGHLVSAAGLDKIVFTPTDGAVSPQVLNIDMTCSTAYASSYQAEPVWQDGHASGLNFNTALKSTKAKLSCITLSPRATTVVKNNINLNASAIISEDDSFDPENADSYNYKTTTTIYDSLGAPYKLTLYFVKEEINKWAVHAYLYKKFLGSGRMRFNTSGILTEVTGLEKLSWLPYSGADSPQYFNVDMTCSTQYGSSSHAVEETWQDGRPSAPNFHAALENKK